MADKRETPDQAHQFLGNINPTPSAKDHIRGRDGSEENVDEKVAGDDAERQAGSRDVDEGGGVATEVGGARNYHHSGGVSGGDVGSRPE